LAELLEQHRRLSHEIDASRTLLDVLPSPVWFRNEDGRLDWVNAAYARAAESSGVREVVRQQLELLDMQLRGEAARCLAAGNAFMRRTEVRHGEERRSMEATILPAGRGSAGILADPSGVAPAGSGDGLRTYAPLLDRVATAIAVFSPDHSLKFWNRSFAALWQLDADWLETRPTHGDILDRLREQRQLEEHPDYRAWKRRQLDIYVGGKVLDERWHLPDGRAVHAIAERGADGGVTCLMENLTERLALQSRFNAMMRVQKETLDNLREGVAVFATDGRLKLHNPAFAAMWKLDAAKLAGDPHVDQVIDMCRTMLKPGDGTWANIKTAITSIHERRQPIEGQFESSDGSIYVYAALPLPDGGMLLNCIDMTDSKRVQKALVERNEALEAGSRLKSAFISHVNYELRTPLTNIIGFSELLSGPHIGKLNDKQSEYLSDILSSSHTLRALIDDILDLTTIDAGAMELQIEQVKVEDVVRAAAEGVRDRLRRAGIKLRIDLGRDVGSFSADRRRVVQVLYNLLVNAIGFSESGTEIRVSCRRLGQNIVMTVEDRGRGIPSDKIASVFERFESRPGGSRHRGAGLGLAIVKSLVELHGGEVSLTSEENHGTTVTVLFPVVTGVVSEDVQPPARAAARA
ncbi:MAG: ATP-binding protein, partial [Pseudomonadota bacterium]|nr:ATP-binding protein [Pseudomonadota bacterium]